MQMNYRPWTDKGKAIKIVANTKKCKNMQKQVTKCLCTLCQTKSGVIVGYFKADLVFADIP